VFHDDSRHPYFRGRAPERPETTAGAWPTSGLVINGAPARRIAALKFTSMRRPEENTFCSIQGVIYRTHGRDEPYKEALPSIPRAHP